MGRRSLKESTKLTLEYLTLASSDMTDAQLAKRLGCHVNQVKYMKRKYRTDKSREKRKKVIKSLRSLHEATGQLLESLV